MAKPTNEKRISDLEAQMKEILAWKESLTVKTVEPIKTVDIEPKPEESQYPIPSEYREIVGTVLNNDFGISLTPLSDSPAFQFTIVVPQKYSTINEETRKSLGADIRPKVISYADGKNGVKQWVELVKSSFSNEIRALIEADRQKQNA